MAGPGLATERMDLEIPGRKKLKEDGEDIVTGFENRRRRDLRVRQHGVSTLVLAGMLCVGSPALAQIARESDEAQAQDTDQGVADIVVTARKQSESVQTVPIAITALSSEQLADNRVFDVSRLGELVPGLVTAAGNYRGFPVIRGITSRSPEAGAEGAVGQYVDEIYQPRISNQLTGLLDLERIEVLKGPQGTLFGRNTIAGAINYVTKRPSDTFEARAEVGAGTRNLLEMRGAVSGPVAPNLAARISVMAMQNDGNVDVINRNGQKFANDGESNFGVRAALRWTPSEDIEINASLSRLQLKGANVDLVSGNPAGPISSRFATLPGTYTPSTFVGDYRNYETALTTPGSVDRKSTQATLRLDWQLAGMTLTSLSAYSTFDQDVVIDIDDEVQPIALNYNFQDSKTFSQELRLAGSSPVIRWSLGANYFFDDHDQREDNVISLPAPYNVTIGSSVHVKTTSWAAFGQVYLTPVERLTIAGGLRYSYDRRAYRKTNSPGLPPFGDAYDSDLIAGWHNRPSWDDLSYTASIDYRITPLVMIYASHSRGYRSGGVQGRATTVATGRANYGPETAKQYEIGAKTTLFDRHVRLNLAAYRIDYEDVQVNQQSFSQFFAGSLIQNAARARMEGIEVDTVIQVNDELSFDAGYSYNDSRFLRYTSTDNIARSIAGIAARPPFCNVRTFGCLAEDYIYDGVPFYYAPKHTFVVGVNATHEFASGAILRFRPTYSWKSGYLIQTVPQSVYKTPERYLEDRFLRQDEFGVLNANLTLDLPGGNWSVGIWGKNLTRSFYAVGATSVENAVNGVARNFRLGERRTVGVTLSWRN